MSDSTPERALGDVVDVSEPVTPETFDVTAFIEGARPARRAVKIHPNGFFVARMEELADLIDATWDGVDVDDMLDEFDACKARVTAGEWYTFEQRSQEWVTNHRNESLSILGKAGTPAELAFRQIAAQCVAPKGVTPESLAALYEVAPLEVDLLAATVVDLNSTRAVDAAVVTRDFSQRRSDSRGTRRSS